MFLLIHPLLPKHILLNSSTPAVSTPVLGVARDPPNVPVSPLPGEGVQSENVVVSTCVGDDKGEFVDMQVSNTTEDTPSEYMSTVCQSLAKLLGHSAQLLEFDQIRTFLKSQTVKLPSELHKHKKLAWYFRKQVCRHKAHLGLLDRDVPEPAMSEWHSHDLKLCLKLICNLLFMYVQSAAVVTQCKRVQSAAVGT